MIVFSLYEITQGLGKMKTGRKKEQKNLTFPSLVQSIQSINEELSIQTIRAINVGLTLRNWLMGCYIAEYELNGADRANYGDKLLDKLSHELGRLKISNCNRRQLYRHLRFYRLYPEIVGTLSPQFKRLLPESIEGRKKVGTLSPQLKSEPGKLLQWLSYSHIEQLIDIKVKNWDAEKYLLQYVSKLPDETLVYCDPPYFNKSSTLYANYYTPQDHGRLAHTIQTNLKANWIVSYDNVPDIVEQYCDRRKFVYSLQYNAAKAYKGSEIFIFSDNASIPSNSEISIIDSALSQIAN